MPNGMYGGVRGRKTKVERKLLRFPPARLIGVRYKHFNDSAFPVKRFLSYGVHTMCAFLM